MILRPLLAAFLLVVGGTSILADQGMVSDQALLQRIEQLEAETQSLRSELDRPQDRLACPPQGTAHPVAFPAESVVIDDPGAVDPSQEDWLTMDELRSMMLDCAWTKGDYKIVPYGSLWGSILYSTARTSPGPYTLYVPSVDSEGEDTFVIDTRRTRVGLDVTGPRIGLLHCAKSGGQIEIDFHGSFLVENKPGVLLRHAYGEVKDENFRLLAGQTWDVISPLYPATLSYSVGWGGGNIGYRRAQVRYERYLHLTEDSTFILQGSLNQNIVSDFAGVAGIEPESSGWPLIEGRMATSYAGYCKPITVGISGHIGNQGFDFVAPEPLRDDMRIRTWSLNLDARVPLGERFGIQGELFMGQDLSTFLGGVTQGVSRVTRHGIRSRGGWIDFWYDITPELHSAAGFGIDDPINVDIVGSGITYNHYIYANATFDVTKKMVVGVEVSPWKTMYLTERPGDAVQFEFMGKYGF